MRIKALAVTLQRRTGNLRDVARLWAADDGLPCSREALLERQIALTSAFMAFDLSCFAPQARRGSYRRQRANYRRLAERALAELAAGVLK